MDLTDDDIAAIRRIASYFIMDLSMAALDSGLDDFHQFPGDATYLSCMGNGASDTVRVEDIAAFVRAAGKLPFPEVGF
jgi:hypothetical protein